VWLVFAAAGLLASSCAYFNTLYNARKIYGEAEQQRIEAEGDERASREKYKQVVEKCVSLVTSYPDSRWVDDALFLMGKALIRQGEYNKGIRKFQEVQANFPESDYAVRAAYWLAYAYYQKRDYSLATTTIERFLEEHPGHELRYDAMFLAGDIYLDTENDEAALSYYARVAEESDDRDRVSEAVVRSAELFYLEEDWENAAAAFEQVMRKGMSDERRYEVSLKLGDCYTRIGRCDEAMGLFDELLEGTVKTRDQPPIVLGRAASYVCKDSLEAALRTYESVTSRFPKSSFSAEAYYRMGVIYHEQLDSLSRAKESFSKVGSEYANSDFAGLALQKANSLTRLIELQTAEGEEATDDQKAERLFLAAEIKLTRLDKVDEAVAGYRAVVDSFPETSVAPRAAFAIAWINERRLEQPEEATAIYRRIVRDYPRTPQARGAVNRLGELGMEALRDSLAAVVDSISAIPLPEDTVAVDTTAAAADTTAATLVSGNESTTAR